MGISHIEDYIDGDDSIMNIPTKLCVIKEKKQNAKGEYLLKIQEIHHIGFVVWLGLPKTVKASIYEDDEGERGPISIFAGDKHYIVPKNKDHSSLYRVALSNKNIYKVKQFDLLKEVVLENNKPLLKDYRLERYKSFSDFGKGVKGTYYLKDSKSEIVVM